MPTLNLCRSTMTMNNETRRKDGEEGRLGDGASEAPQEMKTKRE